MSRLPIVEDRTRPLPTVMALDRLWDEVVSRPLWAGRRFFTYVKLRARTHLRFVSADELTSVVPEGKVNDCSTCTEICCIGHEQTVSLRFRDIATLIDIGRPELMTRDKPVFDAATLAAKPALARTVASESWRRFPVLTKNSFGACQALSNEGKCTLYPHWPTSCARFPYALDAFDYELTYSTRCRSFWIRGDATEKVAAMKVAAVAAYNERIKDLVLLAYAPERLDDLGLLQYLTVE